MMTEDRRKENREIVSLEATWRGVTSKGSARVSDISTGGCFVDTIYQASVGELILLEIKLPSGEWIELRGEVAVYHRNIGFGVRFTALTNEDTNTLSQLKGDN